MAEHRPALAHEPDDDLVAARVEAAWRDLVAAMELRYPVATWPDDRLRDARQKLLEDALSHGELGTKSELGGLRDDASRHYQSAAEMRADAYAMGVVLAERGDESMHYDVCETTDALERVVRGEGPARRIVTSRDENGQKIDLVLDDEEADRTFRAIWEQAARYAHPYRFADVAEPAAAEMLARRKATAATGGARGRVWRAPGFQMWLSSRGRRTSAIRSRQAPKS